MTRKILFFFFQVLAIFVLMLSCSKQIYPTGGNNTVFYPMPPDTARIQFLTRIGSSSDISPGRSKFKTFVAGPENVLPIVKPYGMDKYASKLYVADIGVSGLQIMDFEKNTFDYFIPGGRGKLLAPRNCALDKEGFLYVTDTKRRQVVIFNKAGEYSGEISGPENFEPNDVAISGDTLLVTDTKNNRINAYNKNSRLLLFAFPSETAPGSKNWLYNAQNLCVANGNIYVTDAGDPMIKVFSLNGDFIRSVGSHGNQIGQFVRPKGIAVDREGNLFAVDAAFENIQIFNNEGQLLMFFGGPYKGPGDMYLPAKVTIDYNDLSFFEKYVDPAYRLKYLIFVSNQFGPDKVSVYGRIEPK
jgi:DNA-binding beta-propeller fold protein YncE